MRADSRILRCCVGFTLPELVVTLVVIGIMAAVVVPRFVTRSEFDVFGVANQTRQALRFAQKTAIAKRRQVCVTIAANSVSLQFAQSFGGACNQSAFGPVSAAQYVLPAQSGVSISAASFNFDALGRPSAAQSVSVAGGTASQTILVEAETGYVR